MMFSSRFTGYDDWNDSAARIDIERKDMLDYIKRELKILGIHISDTEIKSTCSDLENVANSEGVYSFGSTREERVTKMIKNRLSQDLRSNGIQGLHQSRLRFLVLCYIAQREYWEWLAKALLKFFDQNETDIVREEEPMLLTEWCLGLHQLKDLLPRDKLNHTFRQIASLGPTSFGDWETPISHHSWIMDLRRSLCELMLHDHVRRRSQFHLGPLYDLPMRGSSVPAFRPSFVAELQPSSHVGYNTTVMSPSISHEMNALHLQQQAQAFELSRIRRDMNSLRHGQ